MVDITNPNPGNTWLLQLTPGMETTKYIICCIHGSLKREETQQVTSTILYNKKWNLVAITKYTLLEKKEHHCQWLSQNISNLVNTSEFSKKQLLLYWASEMHHVMCKQPILNFSMTVLDRNVCAEVFTSQTQRHIYKTTSHLAIQYD